MKRVLHLILILSLVLPVNSFGECVNDVLLLDKNEKSPCRGYLFSPKKEKEVYVKIEEHKIQKKQLELKDLKIQLYEKDLSDVEKLVDKEKTKAELWRNRAEDSTKKLVDATSNRGSRDFLFILLGIGLTVGAGFAIGAAGK